MFTFLLFVERLIEFNFKTLLQTLRTNDKLYTKFSNIFMRLTNLIIHIIIKNKKNKNANVGVFVRFS